MYKNNKPPTLYKALGVEIVLANWRKGIEETWSMSVADTGNIFLICLYN